MRKQLLPGEVGLHLIRVSGAKSLYHVRQIFNGFPKTGVESHRVYYGQIQSSHHLIDEVLVCYFEKGRSFTGDETVEISCHGNPVIVDQILDSLRQLDCRLAERGEFTYRAYKNKRIDLAQAESILSLIHANSQSAASRALKVLTGQLKGPIDKAMDLLVWCLSRLEANIDFGAEDIEVEPIENIEIKLMDLQKSLMSLIQNFEKNKTLDEGVATLIIGPPNAGKSSLLNALLGFNRSIVTDRPGTTRDFISESICLSGILLKLIDTAGLRTTNDFIENLGIQKSLELTKEADLILFIIDGSESESLEAAFEMASDKIQGRNLILIINKVDLLNSKQINRMKQSLSWAKHLVFISLKDNKGLDQLINQIVQDIFLRN